MKKLILFYLIVFTINTYSQDVPDSLLLNGWNLTGVVGLNLSQTAFSNWAQGGSNALAFAAYTNLGAIYNNFPWKVKNRLNVAYGRTKIGEEDYRTTENDIYFESVGSRNIGWAVDPYIALTFRSALTKGYDYAVADTTIQTVDFFDPGYLTEAIGFTYDQNKIISTRLGIAFQQTFANKFTSYSDDPETPNEIEKFKFDTGLESVTEVNYGFLGNMTYYGFLRLFTRFDELNVWDVRWDNIITAKVNTYINVNLSVTVLHEISQTRKTQIREALQLGFSYSLF